MNIECWEDFQSKVDEIKSKYVNSEKILFRGQPESSCSMQLTNTLERYTNSEMTLESYLDITLNCLNPIESFTGKKFNLPDKEIIINEINEKSNPIELHLPTYEFWIYLRHHGFPSPFLDWTSSPYIAAFFAFSGQNIADRCSIYVYIERPEGVKSHLDPSPKVWTFGPNTKAHKRHFLQKSWYTMALKAERVLPNKLECHNHKIISHKEIIKPSNENQDLILEISIPREESLKVLNYLDQYNINQYSLFQSEEALIQTLARKEIF